MDQEAIIHGQAGNGRAEPQPCTCTGSAGADAQGREEAAREPCRPADGPACGTEGCACCEAVGRLAPEPAHAPDTRSLFRIPDMDCPVEEALIRKALTGMPGVRHLEFDLMRRILTVDHDPGPTTAIEEALRAIDMTPEPMAAVKEAEAVFHVAEMDCPVEEKLVRDALSGLAGVHGVECNLMNRTVRVLHEEGCLPAISARLASLSLGARLMETASDTAAPKPAFNGKRLALAVVLAALSEAAALVEHWQMQPFGLDLSSVEVAGVSLLAAASLVFAVLSIVIIGPATYRKGWLAIRNRNLNINALMSVAVTGAVLLGEFSEAAMVMVLFTVSEALEGRALDTARNAIRKLLALSPQKATVLQADGTWAVMDIREVALGSCIRVQPGEKIALDGTVVHGHSSVNQAPITGESLPVEKGEGDQVFAGTINENGSFEFVSTALSTDTTLARIIDAVENAQGSKAPVQRFVDVFATWYTPAIFLVALLAAILPPLALGSPWLSSIYTALVVLVIGCPCALVISTPVTIVSGLAAATRLGILIKGGVHLELGRKLAWIALDKTGTLTHGKPVLTDFHALGDLGDERVRTLAASLAARSDHPISRAVAHDALAAGKALEDVEDFEAIAGAGTRGRMAGRTWHLGNLRLAQRLGLSGPELEEEVAGNERRGRTVVMLMDEHRVQGLFCVADTIKESSTQAIRELKRLGVKTIMLTGDNAHTSAAIAAQTGVDTVRSELLPEDKLRVIEDLEKKGNLVGMVGDGINDAPALAKATIGFAMARGGTDTAIETADVALMDDDLRKIPRFIRLSRATCAIIAENISIAILIKAATLALTFAGHVSMLMAVFADVGTTMIVVANGLRATRK